MEEITFRPAKPEDASVLFVVKIAAYADEFKRFGYAEAGYKDIVDDCRVERARADGMFSRQWHGAFCSFGDWTLVIEAGSKVIGSICAQPGHYFQDDYPDYDVSGSVNVLFCIYVLPEYQNKGIGARAIEYMEQLHPADRWILDTPRISPKNNHFYPKCGYTRGASALRNVYTKGNWARD